MKEIIKKNLISLNSKTDIEKEIRISGSVKVEYSLCTCFSKLADLRKKANILRKCLFERAGLVQIEHDNEGFLIFEYKGAKSPEKIKLQMRDPVSGKQRVWSVGRSKFNPEESLAPWHYQPQHIKFREKVKEERPLSSLVRFYESRDFGFNKIKEQFTKSQITLKELLEKSSNSLEMDFSDFICQKKEEHYNQCIDYILKYFKKKEIELIISDTGKYGSWRDLKNICQDLDLLFEVIKDIKANRCQISPEKREQIIKHLTNIDTGLKDDFSNLGECLGIRLHLLSGVTIPGDSIFSKKFDHYAVEIYSEKVLSDRTELIKWIEQRFSYKEATFSLGELNNKRDEYSFDHSINDHGLFIGPKTINASCNLLDSSIIGTLSQNGNRKYTSEGDIVVSKSAYSLGCIAVVDTANVGRPLGRGVGLLGNVSSGKDIFFWHLLRAPYVRKQVAYYADINIKEICHHALFDRIYIDIPKYPYNNLYRLSFEIASLASSEYFNFNDYNIRFLTSRFGDLIKRNIKSTSIDYFVLMHKINILSDGLSTSRSCLIIHNEKSRSSRKLKKYEKILSPYFATCKFCDITSYRNEVLDAVSQSDFCLLYLSFDNAAEIILTKEILRIVGNKHIAVCDEKEDDLFIDFLESNFDSVNYYNCYRDGNMDIIHAVKESICCAEYKEKIFRSFMFELSWIPADSFKLVKCQGKSVARKAYTSKDLSVYNDLREILAYMSKEVKLVNYSFDNTLLLLHELEYNLAYEPSFGGCDSIWNSFKKKYSFMINSRKLSRFIEKNKNYINEDNMPNLHAIFNKGKDAVNIQIQKSKGFSGTRSKESSIKQEKVKRRLKRGTGYK